MAREYEWGIEKKLLTDIQDLVALKMRDKKQKGLLFLFFPIQDQVLHLNCLPYLRDDISCSPP